MFPAALAARLMESFLPSGSQTVLDPFAGTGSTLVAAEQLGKQAIGLELSPEFVALAANRPDGPRVAGPVAPSRRAKQARLRFDEAPSCWQPIATPLRERPGKSSFAQRIGDRPVAIRSRKLDRPVHHVAAVLEYFESEAHGGRQVGPALRQSGTRSGDDRRLRRVISRSPSTANIFADVLRVLKPGAHCCIVVMDLRKKNRFYPFHSDLAARLQSVGYEFDDLIIWNRQSEYNNLRPLGYPAVFRVNKVHEFVVLMRKPS